MKKKLFCIILAVMMLSACGNEDEDIVEKNEKEEAEIETEMMTEEETEEESEEVLENTQILELYEDEEWYYGENAENCYVQFNTIYLSEEDSVKYPRLNEALNTMNYAEMDTAAVVAAELDEMSEAFPEEASVYLPLYEERTLFNKRADTIAVSFMQGICNYSGGAHPNYYYKGINFDTETGEEIELSEVIRDYDRLPQIFQEKLEEKYPDTYFFEENLEEYFNGYECENYEWTLGYDGITFYFSPYEIASFADGLLTATITFEEDKELFEEKYMAVPKDYAVSVSYVEDVYVDADDDNTRDDLLKMRKTSENCLQIEVNGYTFDYEIGEYVFEVDKYLVNANGKDYMWLCAVGEGRYSNICSLCFDEEGIHATYTYDVSFVNENVVCGKMTDGTPVYTSAEMIFTNPDEFEMETIVDVLGTLIGKKTYCVEDYWGVPESREEYYLLTDCENVLTLKKNLEVMIDDEYETINSGEELSYLKTDGERYIYMLLEDGRECLIEVEDRYINGEHETDYFDGIEYAG